MVLFNGHNVGTFHDGDTTSTIWFGGTGSIFGSPVQLAYVNQCRKALTALVALSGGFGNCGIEFVNPGSGVGVFHNTQIGDIWGSQTFTEYTLGHLITEGCFLSDLSGQVPPEAAAYLIEIECDESYHAVCRGCFGMQQYDYRTTRITLSSPNVWQQVLGANANRVSMAISIPFAVASGNAFKLAYRGDDSYQWWQGNIPYSNLFAYRDFGPLIHEALFWNIAVSPATITVAEIVKVGR